MRLVTLLWLACAAVLFARRPDLLGAPQLYAEDGVIFFRDAALSGVASLFAPYAGYHHAIPRVIALIALPLPSALQPAAYAWISVALAAACCAVLAALLRNAVADAGLRAFTALGVAAATPSDEIIGSVAALQWYLHLPMLAASLAVLPGRVNIAARVAAVLIGATTPQGLIAAPIAAALWWRKPAGFDPWIATLYAGASLLNVLTSPRAAGGRATPHVAESFVAVTAFRVGDALALGRNGAMELAAHATVAGVALGLALLAALLGALAWRRSTVFAAAFAYLILAPVALVLATRSFDAAGVGGYAFFGADRYFVAPCAAVVVAVAALAATIRRAALARAAAVAVLGYGAFANFREPRVPPDDHWAAAAPALDAWRTKRDGGAPAPAVTVPIPPPTWAIALPACSAGGHGGPLPRCP
ncbi:MAG TPA: hypothetical protein VGT98_10250 [Candidatus Elarobacter sp.]|nr:hypothetical protein [Candidatus Elarobacter sp.]HEV2739634.1 hypothetical protein [Candidatus Elarobacter sp.]